MPDVIELGEVVGKIRFDLPEKEQKKLDGMTKQVPMMDKFFKGFSASGAAGVGGAAALLGGVAALFMAGSGFKAVLGTLFDLLGMVSDLLFIALFPVIKPLLDSFIDFAKLLKDKSKGPGGIFGALLDPAMWIEAAVIFLKGILDSGAELFRLGGKILEGLLAALTGSPELDALWDGAGASLADSFINFIGQAMYFATTAATLLATILTDPSMMSAWFKIGLKIADAFIERITPNIQRAYNETKQDALEGGPWNTQQGGNWARFGNAVDWVNEKTVPGYGVAKDAMGMSKGAWSIWG